MRTFNFTGLALAAFATAGAWAQTPSFDGSTGKLVIPSVAVKVGNTTTNYSVEFELTDPSTYTFRLTKANLLASGPVTFSTGFAANSLTVEGGAFGGYGGSNLDNFGCNGQPAWCGGGGGFAPSVPAGQSNYFFYYQTPSPATGLYVGIYIQAPGLTTGISQTGDTPGVQLSGQTTMKFTFHDNPEWFQSATRNFGVILTLGKYFNAGGPCNIKLLKVVTPTASSPTAYSIPLSSFAVLQNCNVAGLTAASALAQYPISQVDFQGAGGPSALSDGTLSTGANLSVPNSSQPPVYPSTVVVTGGISFE